VGGFFVGFFLLVWGCVGVGLLCVVWGVLGFVLVPLWVVCLLIPCHPLNLVAFPDDMNAVALLVWITSGFF